MLSVSFLRGIDYVTVGCPYTLTCVCPDMAAQRAVWFFGVCLHSIGIW